MKGTIYFYDLKQVAEFLKHFTDSTATFEVKQDSNHRWLLVFTEGF